MFFVAGKIPQAKLPDKVACGRDDFCDDVHDGLRDLKKSGHRLYAFSNGLTSDIEMLLSHAGIRDFFTDIVSVDEIKSFKPDPACYSHFLNRAASSTGNGWLVSCNSFDVIGAGKAGMKTA